MEFDEIIGRGATGELILRADSLSLFSDFEHFIAPGLRASGIELRPTPISYSPSILESLSREVALRKVPLLHFAADPFTRMPESQDPNLLTTPIPTLIERKSSLKRQGVLLRTAEERLFWTEPQGGEAIEMEGTFFELQQRFNCAIELRRGAKKGGVSENREAAVRRFCAFDIAYPERSVLSAGDIAEASSGLTEFLTAISGERKDRLAVRWRQAANAFAKSDQIECKRLLFESALMTLNLPPRLFATLNASPEFSLHPAELRELLYLARAGTRYLRLFSLYRLSSETHLRDVKQTLETLVFCSDPLVRAAAFARSGSSRK